ncbi:hypothetical protein, partial [Tenacibaculum discolor]|uniref:hypothetical protein n=1 Tax=Tenacibaculum discolor TaxID=361581 RepID=UPI001F32D3F8
QKLKYLSSFRRRRQHPGIAHQITQGVYVQVEVDIPLDRKTAGPLQGIGIWKLALFRGDQQIQT